MTLAAATTATGAAEEEAAGRKDERPAPPDRFVVTTAAGQRLTGAPARLEIKHRHMAQAPEVELFFSASGGSDQAWAAHAAAPARFLETLNLSSPVVDRPLEPGEASVSVSRQGGDASFAPSGLLQLRVEGGRLTGEASGMSDRLAATFEGPIVVTCAVPAAALTAAPPAPASGAGLPSLIVDERFESALCERYAALTRR